jgi:hydrogenase-4 component B
MQYTGSSFAELSAGLFGSTIGSSDRLSGAKGLFPGVASFAQATTERILDRMIIPFLLGADWCLAWLRRMQGGHLHLYILYVFATLFVLMVWSHV